MLYPDAPSWCEISAAAIAANIANLRRGLSAGTLLGIVVKSNAYGHGLVLCAREFAAAGADWLVVNAATEAQALRRACIEVPIYICGPLFPEDASVVADCRAEVAVSDEQTVEALARAGRASGNDIGVHIKLETGTNRQGVPPGEALALGQRLQALEGVALRGLTTHYADIEDTTEHDFALGQLQALNEAAAAFRAAGLPQPVVHSANSAATLVCPQTHADLVRVGISAYGLWPSGETYATAMERHLAAGNEDMPSLLPVLNWRARVAQVKEVSEGAYIGYGRTFRAAHHMRIAVLPVGFYEGYDRRLSNVGQVLIGGVRAPVRGRICMNMAMVDITHIPDVRPGAVATLLGSDGEDQITAEQWGRWMNSIHYEAVSRIPPAQPRSLCRNHLKI